MVVLSDGRHLFIHKSESNESMLSWFIFYLKSVNFLFLFSILKHRVLGTIQNLLILSNFKISTAVQKACVRKLSDWNRGLPRSFLAQTVCPQLAVLYTDTYPYKINTHYFPFFDHTVHASSLRRHRQRQNTCGGNQCPDSMSPVPTNVLLGTYSVLSLLYPRHTKYIGGFFLSPISRKLLDLGF